MIKLNREIPAPVLLNKDSKIVNRELDNLNNKVENGAFNMTMDKKRYTFTLFFLLFTFLVSLAQNTIKETTVNVNFRSEPNTSSTIFEVIPKGTTVTLLENCDCDWIPISYNGKIGYISTRFLRKPISKSPQYRAKTSSGIRSYVNSDGVRVQSPTRYDSRPAGATALCRDGTYSFSRNRRGTCSHHGGVARWL